ncbi:SigB/SigF/SigG family RNA polymerase sigma factor [Kitasatospora sp. NBC_01539]|uniref:SigB/SigF/SigG family RNA polymerase sigma factor n=1 Tax=Kitasatospora sp. NBC_01539 TaxID=2903577 RepID=UPI0038602882
MAAPPTSAPPEPAPATVPAATAVPDAVVPDAAVTLAPDADAPCRRPGPDELRAMGKAEARALSDALFRRLAGLEPGTREFSYVRGTVIELNMPLVRFAAAGFRHRSAELDDIVQVGTVGLIKAVDGYDLDRGVEFLTYAIPTITGEIKRFFRDTTWPVRMPRSLQEMSLSVARAADRLEQDLGRPPTVQELSDDLGVDPERVTAGLGAGRAYRSDSLDSLRDDGSDEPGTSLLDRLGACDPDLALVEFRESVRPLLRDLPERERAVLQLRFWGDRTQSQIAEAIGVSQMHVSRILAGILERLRESLEDAPGGPERTGE